MSLCSFEGCNEKSGRNKYGYCRNHLRQLKRKGYDKTKLKPIRIVVRLTCKFHGCEKKHKALGYCKTHYEQYRLNKQDSSKLKPIKYYDSFCIFDGCKRKHSTNGLCATHYTQFRMNGRDFSKLTPIREKKGYHLLKRSGYVVVHKNCKQYMQHRLVMEEMLGHPIPDGYNVHHKNGVKHDNRPENLELISTKKHFTGIRLIDRIKWLESELKEAKELKKKLDT